MAGFAAASFLAGAVFFAGADFFAGAFFTGAAVFANDAGAAGAGFLDGAGFLAAGFFGDRELDVFLAVLMAARVPPTPRPDVPRAAAGPPARDPWAGTAW